MRRKSILIVQGGLILGLACLVLCLLRLGWEHGTEETRSAPSGGATDAHPGAQASVARKQPSAGQEEPPQTSAEPKAAPTSSAFRLADADTGEPLARRSASLLIRKGTSFRPESITTDDRGAFDLSGLEPGAHAITTRLDGYLPDHRAVEVRDVAAAAEIVIRLAQGAELQGEVVTVAGAPVPGTAVRLALLGEQVANASALSNQDGAFTIRGLLPGVWKVSAAREGFRRASTRVSVPRGEPLRIEMRGDPGFIAVVTDESGSPVAGARVAVRARTDGLRSGAASALSDDGGEVRLSGLPDDPADEVAVEASHRGHAPWRRVCKGSELEAGPLRILLSRGVDVSGRVLDAGGAAVPAAEVHLLGGAAKIVKTLKTTARGEFRFTKVEPGTYDLLAVTPARGSGRLLGVGAPSGIGANGLDIVLEEGSGVIAGRIVDSSGQGVPLCPVVLRLSAGPGAGGGPPPLAIRTVSQEDGGFRFAGLPSSSPGHSPCEVTAGGGNHSRTARAVQPGKTDLELVVLPLGGIRGFVTAAGEVTGFAITISRKSANREGEEGEGLERTFRFASTDPWFRLKGLEAGTYTLTLVIRGEARAVLEDVEVRPGEETGPIELHAGEGP